MTERQALPGRNRNSHTYLSSTYGGEIYESDFCTGYCGRTAGKSVMASRIVNAWIFDRQCIRNAEIRELQKKRDQE